MKIGAKPFDLEQLFLTCLSRGPPRRPEYTYLRRFLRCFASLERPSGGPGGPNGVQKGVQEGSKTGPKVWFLLSVLDGKHYCRGGNFLENENIDYFIGFMCKSEMCDFGQLFEILGPEFGGQRASQGLPWEPPFSYFLGVQMLSVLAGKQYLRFGPPRESIEILAFCSRSLPGSIISNSCVFHLSKIPSKMEAFCHTGTIKNPQLFIAFMSFQGP